MYEVGTFSQSSAYAGRRVLFESDVFTVEGAGPIDVRQLPGFVSRGEFAWASDDARTWAEQYIRSVTAAPSVAAPQPRRTAWVIGIATVIILGLCGLCMAVVIAFPTDPEREDIPRDGGVVIDKKLPPELPDDPENPGGPKTPITPQDPVKPREFTAAEAQAAFVGTWAVTQGSDAGSRYEFGDDGRVFWDKSNGDSWEMEWFFADSGALTLRRGKVSFSYAWQMSADGGAMQWTDLSGREPQATLVRER